MAGSADAQRSLGVNIMPFDINYSGPAPVSAYMKVSDDNGKLSSHFRGRAIRGEVVSLPESISGIVASRPDKSSSTIHMLGTFGELKLWEHDVAPSTGMVTDLFDWVDIAKAVVMCPS